MSHHSRTARDDMRRKRVRKGTHSCWECKRRKVRCIFRPESHQVCAGCLSRGTPCQSQQFVDDEITPAFAPSVPDRIGRLETLMETVLQRLESSQQSLFVSDQSQDLPTPSPRSSCVTDDVTILSLFENEVIHRDDHSALLGDASRSSTIIHNERIRTGLISALPPQSDMQQVFELTGGWWDSWQLGYSGVCIGDHPLSLSDFVSHALIKGRPTDLAIVILCFAMSLHYLPSNFDIKTLQQLESMKDRVGICLDAAGSVTADDQLAGSIEGLECLILQSKLCLVMEQPRRAWLGYRRAMSIAESLRLHRSVMRLTSESDDMTSSRKQSVWWQIYQADRALSLLLGFSNGMPDTYCDLEFEEPTTGRNYIRKVSVIASRLVERNQANSVNIQNGHATTKEINEQLDTLINQMPADWCDLSPQAVAKDGERVWMRLLPQLWHYQIAVLLHLPYMLRSGSNPAFAYHKSKCLEAAREMASRFLILNDRTRCALRTCKTVEFQAFISTVVIVLNQLENDSHKTSGGHIGSKADWAIVNNMIHDLRNCSKDKHAVEFRAADVLEVLKEVGQNGAGTGRAFKVNIPYFGSISIARRRRPEVTVSNPSSVSQITTTAGTALSTTELDLFVTPSEQAPTIADTSTAWPSLSFMGAFLTDCSNADTFDAEHMLSFGVDDYQFPVDHIQVSNMSWD